MIKESGGLLKADLTAEGVFNPSVSRTPSLPTTMRRN
jgi:hypothetical protein